MQDPNPSDDDSGRGDDAGDDAGDDSGDDSGGDDSGGDDTMNMDRTLSDDAQRKTIAFDGLRMVTGNLQAQSFFPPGKVADYWGFQYLRDNDPDDMGHNTSFLTRVADNVLFTLRADQLALLEDLAAAQGGQIDEYGYRRRSRFRSAPSGRAWPDPLKRVQGKW